MPQFQHIEYFWGLLLLPLMLVLYWQVIRWKKNTIKKIGDELLVRQLIKTYSPAKFSIKFFLIVIAFTTALIALANLRLPNGSTTVKKNGIDVMIALDVSKSMLAQDIKPNRLERARQLVAKLIDQLPDDRIGLVVFAGRAYLQMPLTTDHAAAKLYLSTANPDIVPTQGTVIATALKMCATAFDNKDKKYKSVLLISDGEDHDDNAIQAAKELSSEGVMINTVGIGSPDGAMIQDAITNEYKKDAAGNPVISKLDETELKDIAAEGDGLYQLFTNVDDVVEHIDTQLQGMGQKNITDVSLLNYQTFYPWFLGAALLLLLTEFFISETKKQTIGLKKLSGKTVFLTLLCMSFSFYSFSQNAYQLIKKGNDAYNEKNYTAAIENYQEAIAADPLNEKAAYNLGNALYKVGKINEALAMYDLAVRNSHLPVNKAKAWYNKAVLLQNIKKLNECIDAYKNALRLNPADEDARLNLQKALQQQKKEQKDKKDSHKEQPQPQQSKMTKQEAEERLKALLQQEKKLQDKLKKVDAAAPDHPEKDW